MDLTPLNFKLLQGRAPTSQSVAAYNAAYNAWHALWQPTLRELNGDRYELASDPFLLSDEVGVLCYSQDVIGLCLFNWVDLRLAAYRRSSLFDSVAPSVLSDLVTRGHCHALSIRYLAVAAAWRGDLDGLSIKRLMSALMAQRFLASTATIMLGTARRDKGIPSLVQHALGAEVLQADFVTRGMRVDFMGVPRDALKQDPDPLLVRTATRLWQPRGGARDAA